MQEKLGVVSLFKDIPGPFELFHKNFLKTSCAPRTAQDAPVDSCYMGQRGRGEWSAGKADRLLFHIRDLVSVLKEHHLYKTITSHVIQPG